MTELVRYESSNGIATITLQNGKANALSTPLFKELNAAFDKAEKNDEVLILTSDLKMLSGGFDLKEMQAGGPDAIKSLVATGSRFTIRMLNFPLPIIVAVPGHAIAKGAFIAMCADYGIGVEGNFKIGLNETAIGMTMHHVGIQLAVACLDNRFAHRSIFNAEIYDPQTAMDAGFIDMVVEPEKLQATALQIAENFKTLDLNAFAGTKQRARKQLILELEAAVDLDLQGEISFSRL